MHAVDLMCFMDSNPCKNSRPTIIRADAIVIKGLQRHSKSRLCRHGAVQVLKWSKVRPILTYATSRRCYS